MDNGNLRVLVAVWHYIGRFVDSTSFREEPVNETIWRETDPVWARLMPIRFIALSTAMQFHSPSHLNRDESLPEHFAESSSWEDHKFDSAIGVYAGVSLCVGTAGTSPTV